MNNLPALTKEQQTAVEYINFANNSGRTPGCIYTFWNWVIVNDVNCAMSIIDNVVTFVPRMNKAAAWLNENLYNKAMAFHHLRHISYETGGTFSGWCVLETTKAPKQLPLAENEYQKFTVKQFGDTYHIVSVLVLPKRN